MNRFQQSTPIPPRQFPKRQYKKLIHHIWSLIIGIVIVVILIGIIFMMVAKPASHHVAHHVKSSQPIQKPKLIHHRSKTSKITPKQGEKILGDWLIKLNYLPNQSQKILINYQELNQIQEITLAHQLANYKQPNQIKKLINQKLNVNH